MDFESFCLDNYPEVYQKFTRGMQFDEQINLLLDPCSRNEKEKGNLVSLLEENFPGKKPEHDAEISAPLEPEKRSSPGAIHLEKGVESLVDQFEELYGAANGVYIRKILEYHQQDKNAFDKLTGWIGEIIARGETIAGWEGDPAYWLFMVIEQHFRLKGAAKMPIDLIPQGYNEPAFNGEYTLFYVRQSIALLQGLLMTLSEHWDLQDWYINAEENIPLFAKTLRSMQQIVDQVCATIDRFEGRDQLIPGDLQIESLTGAISHLANITAQTHLSTTTVGTRRKFLRDLSNSYDDLIIYCEIYIKWLRHLEKRVSSLNLNH